jgi:hypothetical protein
VQQLTDILAGRVPPAVDEAEVSEGIGGLE